MDSLVNSMPSAVVSTTYPVDDLSQGIKAGVQRVIDDVLKARLLFVACAVAATLFSLW